MQITFPAASSRAGLYRSYFPGFVFPSVRCPSLPGFCISFVSLPCRQNTMSGSTDGLQVPLGPVCLRQKGCTFLCQGVMSIFCLPAVVTEVLCFFLIPMVLPGTHPLSCSSFSPPHTHLHSPPSFPRPPQPCNQDDYGPQNKHENRIPTW